jgi:hypothetical protein
MVYRNGIWYKLSQCGVSSRLVKMFQKIYEQVKCCVRVNGNYTENYESIKGVKQGEPLSPLLFLFFVNDMQHCIYDVYMIIPIIFVLMKLECIYCYLQMTLF